MGLLYMEKSDMKCYNCGVELSEDEVKAYQIFCGECIDK